jgi:hypothetical protein
MFSDIDECASGNFECEPNSVCRNLPSTYYCTCRLGYKFNGKDGCELDQDFEFDEAMVTQVEAGETEFVRPKSLTGARSKIMTTLYCVIAYRRSQTAQPRSTWRGTCPYMQWRGAVFVTYVCQASLGLEILFVRM